MKSSFSNVHHFSDLLAEIQNRSGLTVFESIFYADFVFDNQNHLFALNIGLMTYLRFRAPKFTI